jgi:hypothetical protein
MTPGERRALADQVGIADAGDLIERLATRKGGLSPSAVQRALDAVGNKSVGDLRQVVRSLRDPQQREKLLERGLDAAAEAMSEPKAEEAAEAPRKERSTPVGPAAAAAAAATAATAGAARKRRQTRPPAPDPEPPAPPAETVAKQPAVESSTAPSPPIEKPEGKPVTLPVTPPATTPPSGARLSEVPPAPQPSAAAEPTTPAAIGIPLLDRISHEPMLIRRFRILRQRVDEARGMTASQLRDLIDLYPPGWGRRRALDALLESGIPGSLNKAIFLIEHLKSESERRWCVSTLLHEWELTDEEKSLLADRHGMFHGGSAAG